MEPDIKEFSISDMYLASAVIAYKKPYTRIDRENPKRLKFIFEDGPMKVYILRDGSISVLEFLYLDQIQAAYTSNTLMFPPGFPDAIRRVKSAIHSEK